MCFQHPQQPLWARLSRGDLSRKRRDMKTRLSWQYADKNKRRNLSSKRRNFSQTLPTHKPTAERLSQLFTVGTSVRKTRHNVCFSQKPAPLFEERLSTTVPADGARITPLISLLSVINSEAPLLLFCSQTLSVFTAHGCKKDANYTSEYVPWSEIMCYDVQQDVVQPGENLRWKRLCQDFSCRLQWFFGGTCETTQIKFLGRNVVKI